MTPTNYQAYADIQLEGSVQRRDQLEALGLHGETQLSGGENLTMSATSGSPMRVEACEESGPGRSSVIGP